MHNYAKHSLIFIFFVFSNAVFANFMPEINYDSGIMLLKNCKFSISCNSMNNYDKNFLDAIFKGMELRFKSFGVEPQQSQPWLPKLHFYINVFGNDNSLYYGNIEISFQKDAIFTSTNTHAYCKVWAKNICFNYASKDHLKQLINDLLDEFLLVYLKANPRKFIKE